MITTTAATTATTKNITTAMTKNIATNMLQFLLLAQNDKRRVTKFNLHDVFHYSAD